MVLPTSWRGVLVLLSATSAAAKALLPRACKFTSAALEGDTCEILAESWRISVEKFVSWNPDVDCERDLEVGRGYCIQWEGPEPTTTTSGRITWGVTTLRPPTTTTTTTRPRTTTTTTKKTTTTTTTKKPTTTTTPKPTPKPSTTTTRKVTTTPVRPGVPSPTQPGTTTDCAQYHKVRDIDTCISLVDEYGRSFTLAQFLSWNPNLGYDCRDMWTDYYVCIAVKSTAQPVPAPGTTQPGVNPRCNKWYFVKDGDYCEAIVAKYGISLQTFYNWNPSVGSDCRSMWAQSYVCVGSA